MVVNRSAHNFTTLILSSLLEKLRLEHLLNLVCINRRFLVHLSRISRSLLLTIRHLLLIQRHLIGNLLVHKLLLTDHVALKGILDATIARILSGIRLILVIGEGLSHNLTILVVLLRLGLSHLRAKRTSSLRHTSMLFLHRALSRVRKLPHKHSKGSNKGNEVCILGTQYSHLVPFESLLVHFLLLLKLASFARFNVRDEQIAIFEGNLRAGEFGSASSLAIFKTHESHLTVRVKFHI